MRVSQRKRRTKLTNGRYAQIKKRLMGFLASGVILPRTKMSISIGTSDTPSIAAKNIEKVFVNASGLNKRPSWASSEKTGMKLTVMTSSAKKSGLPTLLAAAMITSTRSTFVGSRPFSSRKGSRNLCAFSTMMMAESTMAPMAIAMPPSDMMLQVKPSQYIGRNERKMAIGSGMMAANAERMCQRKIKDTHATRIL